MGGDTVWCEQGVALINMTIMGVLGCRCTESRGVTLAMVATAERSQPSVLGHEDVTQHHCLVRQATPGSLGGLNQ